jgi:hypothetical protein
MTEEHTEPRRLEINWVQAAGGALAAVSSAVLLSTLGVAGTILGAAAGSVVVTVGNSIYSHYLAASKERVAAATVAAREQAARIRERRSGRGTATSLEHRIPPPDEQRRDADEVDEADETDETVETAETAETAGPGDAGAGTQDEQRPGWRDVVRGLPWKRLAVIATGVFVLTMAAILSFELVTGHAVSSYTGGSDKDGPRTSFGGNADPDNDKPEPAKTTESTPAEPTSTPTESPTTAETTTVPPEDTEEPTTTAPTTPAPTTTAPPSATTTSTPTG